MRAVNCPRCGRLFNKILSPVCAKCEKEEEEQFKHLRDYIEEFPFANINEVSDETGIKTKRILQYIREGRIIVSSGLAGELRCAQCGTAIEEGSFCPPCAAKMAKDLASSIYPSDDKAAEEPAVKQKTEARPSKKGIGFHTSRRS